MARTVWLGFVSALALVGALVTSGGLRADQPQASPRPLSRVEFTQVFSLGSAGLTAPIAVRIAPMEKPRDLSEVGGTVEREITVGRDGYVRDALVKNARGSRLEAYAIFAAANSQFKPGIIDGRAVAVRMPLTLSVPAQHER